MFSTKYLFTLLNTCTSFGADVRDLVRWGLWGLLVLLGGNTARLRDKNINCV